MCVCVQIEDGLRMPGLPSVISLETALAAFLLKKGIVRDGGREVAGWLAGCT